MEQVTEKFYKRDFWAEENLRYSKPHFRLAKAARIVNRIARGRKSELLDVGCGPATLASVIDPNIAYYGIDIAIQSPAPNLLQADFVAEPIRFGNKQFDIVVAQGVFEYVGAFQADKFAEIKRLLRPEGKFVASYVNFDHINRFVYEPYSNVQPLGLFRESLRRIFRIDRCFPTSYHLHHHEPQREWMKTVQMRINMNLPVLGRKFGVEYFFICSLNASDRK
jgi:SAM-dependent methyltransferase